VSTLSIFEQSEYGASAGEIAEDFEISVTDVRWRSPTRSSGTPRWALTGDGPLMREAVVRYYIDADLLGLAKVICRIRPDITYPGDPGDTIHKSHRPACPITDTAAPDTDWVPIVAAQGWLIITRDHNIRDNLPSARLF
jgi:hypothetical protein